MVILLCYTSAFSEVIYANFYAKILHWNFRLVDENSQILVVVFVSNLNFSFSFRFVDEKCGIFVVVVVFMTKINLFSSTKIFVFVVVDEKNTGFQPVMAQTDWPCPTDFLPKFCSERENLRTVGRMPFPWSNQRCQITNGKTQTTTTA